MVDFLQRLKQRKLAQWAIAYLAGAWVLLQVLELIGNRFGWPAGLLRGVFIAVGVGFIVTLLLAWYHGDRGAQKVSGIELMLLALVLVIGGALLWRFSPEPVSPEPASASRSADSAAGAAASGPQSTLAEIPEKSIAVLPFANLSSDKENEYFVAGMQDLILGKLSDIGELKVISRTSTLKYESQPGNLRQVAAELGVAHILEGSVQKAGNAVLINVQLIDARSDSHLWSESYQRTLDDIFGVEGEVAGKIADALKAKLSPAESTRLSAVPTTNRAAYDAFLQAEYFYHRGNLEFIGSWYRKAIPLYEQALREDPGFVLALAKLSMAESFAEWFDGRDDPALADRARQHAEQALARQPELPDAQCAMGYADYYGRGDFEAALNHFSVAMEARPNDDQCRMASAFVLRRQGRLSAAVEQMQDAVARNPRSTFAYHALGETLLMAHRYTEAEAALQRARAIDPQNLMASDSLARTALLAEGDTAKAIALLSGKQPRLVLRRVDMLRLQRRYDEAIVELEGMAVEPGADGEHGDRELQLADLQHRAGREDLARVLYAQALPLQRARIASLRDNRDLAGGWNQIARALRGLGQNSEALDALSRSQQLAERSDDRIEYPRITANNAMLYARMDRADLAVPLLENMLRDDAGGIYFSPQLLALEPDFDPIRNDPRFQALLKQYAHVKPAVVAATQIQPSTTEADGQQPEKEKP